MKKRDLRCAVKRWVFLVLLIALMTGCNLSKAHVHTWLEATCEQPRTCQECGETEGEALGHVWTEAACEAPRTCSRCGVTEGIALGHEWTEATCETPKTCSRCGKIEGEALGHKWIDATCTEPKTCDRCGKKEGEPAGHKATEADYWNPSSCSVCGIELAPKIVPEMLDGLKGTFMKLGEHYAYKSVCWNNRNVEATEMITVKEYYSIPGSALALEELEGYEWKIVTFEGIDKDPNAYKWNLVHSWHRDNCYEPFTEENTVYIGLNNAGYDIWGFTVDWKGKTFDQCRITEDSLLETNSEIKTKFITHWFYVRVPVGYDGIIIGLINGKNNPNLDDIPLKEEADDDSLFFRLD